MRRPTIPTLEETAKRNPAVVPDRVRQFQQVVKTLQDRGVLQPSKYGLELPLSNPKGSMAAARNIKTMNRVQGGG